MNDRRATLRSLAAGALAATSTRALAQQQDDKSTISVYVGAASSMDYTARLIATQLRESLGRPAIAIAKLGAGQRLALGEVRRAAPDGRSLVFATSGPFAIYPHVYKKLDYDPDADFTPILGVSRFDVAIATGPATGVTDLQQLIAWAKARPGDTPFGSAPGNGSFSHFVGIATAMTTGASLTHVPYKDSGVGIIDLAGGRIPVMITGLSPLVPMHKEGKIRILAVSGPKRSALVPEVPTLRESGVDVSSSTTTGVFGPAKMPPEVVARTYQAILPLLSNTAVTEKLVQQGLEMWPATGQQLAEAIREERAYFGAIAKASGYVPESA